MVTSYKFIVAIYSLWQASLSVRVRVRKRVCVSVSVQLREVTAVVGWAAAGRTVPCPRVTTNPRMAAE